MNRTAASAAFLAVLLSACGKAPPQSAASAARRAAFKDYLPLTAQMRKTANGDSPYRPEEFERLAAEFAREAPRPFQYFQNDPQGNGRARAEIWQQPERFQKRRDDFYAAVAELDAAAQSRAPDRIRAAYERMEHSCRACHDDYRSP